MRDINYCIKKRTKKIFIIEDTHSNKATFENKKLREIIEIKIDDCVIKIGKRCDFLVNIPEIKNSILIELKGSNIEYGIAQLEATHIHTDIKPFLEKNTIHWIIVSNRVDRFTRGRMQVMTEKVRRQHGVKLVIKNIPALFNIE